MSLDLFASNIDDAVGYAGRVSAPELPSTFSDNFDDAFAKGRLVSNSISGNLRKSRALSDYMDEVRAKTGDPLQLPETASIADMNTRVRALKAANPALDVSELTDEEIQRRADEIGVRQLADSQALDRRERTTGGTVGSFLGAAGAAVTDPVNMVAFPLAAPESLGILGTALAWGAIGAGSQTAIEIINAQSMERIQPGYTTTGEPLQNITETALVGGVLGGGLKGLSNLWTKAKTGNWPRTVRDAGNVVESEAQIAATNPLPGIEGEAAHRTALSKAIDDLVNGRPVNVEGIVPPELAKHIEAWHGSPHDFEQFDISRIGTGEGAQAYGHGLYFAEREGVARSYQDALSDAKINGKSYNPDNPFHAATGLAEEFRGRDAALGEAIRRAQQPDPTGFYDQVAAILSSDRPLPAIESSGALYKVKITANKDHMLDWDKVVTDVAMLDKVMAAANQIQPGWYDRLMGQGKDLAKWALTEGDSPKTGASIYGALKRGLGSDEAASEALSKAGVPGIKYLDGGSRAVEEGTHNFVVFDDKHVQITHKNGKPVSAEVRQGIVDQAAGLPPKPPAQPELPLTPPELVKPVTDKASPDAVASLRDELTPAKIEEARVHPDMEETISRDLDKLMLERPDLEVPTGVTVDADGRTVPTTRTIESVVNEADNRLAAAKEIELCVGPYPAQAAE
jgi:hypothetical protein